MWSRRNNIVWSLWRHQQLIVTSSGERKPNEWDTGTMCKDGNDNDNDNDSNFIAMNYINHIACDIQARLIEGK